MSGNITLIAIPLLLILGVATLTDWRVRTIPNVLTFGAALFGLILQGTINGLPGLAIAAGGWIVGLVCFLPFYAKGGMAAGDVKLMAAVGAFLGPIPGFAACLFTLIAGGVIGIVSVAINWGLRLIASSTSEGPMSLRDALRTRIPYAGAIAAGTSIVLLVPALVPANLIQPGY